jgi:hypothetical protein
LANEEVSAEVAGWDYNDKLSLSDNLSLASQTSLQDLNGRVNWLRFLVTPVVFKLNDIAGL